MNITLLISIMSRIYYHSWGDEDVVSAHIEITQTDHEKYTIEFVQESFTKDHFYNIKINGEVLDHKTQERETDIGTMVAHTYHIRAILNPKPEELFRLVK